MNYIQIDNRETELFSILQKKKETHSNLTIEISSPTKTAPSMAMALEQYIIKLAKKK